MTTLLIRTPQAVTDASLPRWVRDPLMQYDTDFLWMVDLAFPWSFNPTAPEAPNQLSVPTGTAIRDMTEATPSRDSAVVVNGSYPHGLVRAGGGVDFSAAEKTTGITIPPAVAEAIYADDQNYLFSFWLKLPAAADWTTGRNIISWTVSSNSNPEIFALTPALSGSTRQLLLTRATAAGVGTPAGASPVPVSAEGAVNQVIVYRHSGGEGLSIRNAAGRFTFNTARGADNSADFSAASGTLGVNWSWGAAPLASSTPAQALLRKFRFYRAWARAGTTDWLAVADADYAQTVARGVFS